MFHSIPSTVDEALTLTRLAPASDTISIADILESYDNWGVPHFQRGSVWGADNIAALLESLYYDTPCGSIILWAPREIQQYGVPLVPGTTCTHLLIDGQQRTRSVYAAFKGLFDVTQATDETEGQLSDVPTDGAGRHWAINLNEVAGFESLLHRTDKRAWPLFVPVSDPYSTEQRRRKTMSERRAAGKVRYVIPESPFKYNFVPLHYFTGGDFGALLTQEHLFLKRKDGNSNWKSGDTSPVLTQLEDLRVKVHQMQTRRLFQKVLGPEVTLDAALRVFIRINSGGRPVQVEEKGFSILVGSCPSTSDWVKTIFARVHPHSNPSLSGLIQHDEVLERMNERSFGFKLFIRVFMLTTIFHTKRTIGARSLSFAALRDRRFLAILDGDHSTYDRLWSATADAVVVIRGILEHHLKLDALQFLPETTSLFPLFLCLIKYPGLISKGGTRQATVRTEFGAGIAWVGLLLLLRDPRKQQVTDLANNVITTQDDAERLLQRMADSLTVEKSSLEEALRAANSLTNRYTLLLYGLQRSLEARDFDYIKNGLTGPEFQQVERILEAECVPEKQHIVPYSHLIEAYNLEGTSRVGSTPANNIGNITYISHVENSLGGLSDTLVDLAAEGDANAAAHFLGTSSVAAYAQVRTLIEDKGTPTPRTLRGLYEGWIGRRQVEIGQGFLHWAGRLEQEWLEQAAQRQGRPRIEPALPILRNRPHGISPPGVPVRQAKRPRITPSQLLAEIDKAGDGARRVAEELLAGAKLMGAKAWFRGASASVRVRNTTTNEPCTLFVLTRRGTFYIGFLHKWEKNAGVGPQCAVAYEAALTKILGTSPSREKQNLAGEASVPLTEVGPHIDEVLAAVKTWAALLEEATPGISAARPASAT